MGRLLTGYFYKITSHAIWPELDGHRFALCCGYFTALRRRRRVQREIEFAQQDGHRSGFGQELEHAGFGVGAVHAVGVGLAAEHNAANV
jgi:hypothetical protein